MPDFRSAPVSRSLERLAITLVCLYLLSPFGATFNGVVIPDAHFATYALILVVLAAWLAMRIRWNWTWHRTALDPIMPLWLLAIAVSLLANPDVSHRSLIALWFVGAYIGAWYLLHDWVANRPASRELIVEGLLASGLIVFIFSALQMLYSGNLLQPVSILGNTNALGSVLLVVIPYSLRKAWRENAGAGRTVWRLYSVAAIFNIIVTLSRGAWIGLFGALFTLLLLALAHKRLLSPAGFLAWWDKRTARTRRLIRALSIAVVSCLLCAMALIALSFTQPERSAKLRTQIWGSALIQFSDAPLTGNGLFTFGRNHGKYVSIPPAQSYAHAHSLPLNVAAELGILGLLALGATTTVTIHRLRRVWHAKTGDRRLDWIFFVAPIAGLALHHLFDFTALMPAVALLCIVALILAIDPHSCRPLASARLGMICAVGLAILWICLLFVGHRKSVVNGRYISALRLATTSSEHQKVGAPALRNRQAIELLDEVIASDPDSLVYHHQAAMLWGLLAAGGDAIAIDRGIESFERFLDQEPYHALAWANLSVLQWQSGDIQAAIGSMEEAQRLAPRLPLFAMKLYQYRNSDLLMRIILPHNHYNQDFTRYQFLQESLPISLLPQISWSFQGP